MRRIVSSRMGDYGKATASERDEVRRLRAEGVSIRGIAEQVFGHARFRGLPGGLRPGKATADDVDSVLDHGTVLSRISRHLKFTGFPRAARKRSGFGG